MQHCFSCSGVEKQNSNGSVIGDERNSFDEDFNEFDKSSGKQTKLKRSKLPLIFYAEILQGYVGILVSCRNINPYNGNVLGKKLMFLFCDSFSGGKQQISERNERTLRRFFQAGVTPDLALNSEDTEALEGWLNNSHDFTGYLPVFQARFPVIHTFGNLVIFVQLLMTIYWEGLQDESISL